MKSLSFSRQPRKEQHRLMLFDLALGGHHGNYIQHVIDYAQSTQFKGTIDIVVLPDFLEIHQDTVVEISKYDSSTINFVSITSEETAELGSRDSGLNRTLRNFREWKVFCKYGERLQTTQALIMYLDTCELPLTVGMRSPCLFSGIYFRPTFHYNTFTHYHPSPKEKFQQWREMVTWNRVLQNPQLQTVFCLDPFATKVLTSKRHKAKIVHLADPVQSQPSSNNSTALREKLGIEEHRQVFLLFGALDGRKGIYQLLDAIQLLSVEFCRNFCLLLVGKTNVAEQAQIQQRVAALRQSHPIQLVERYDFVPESEVPNYFHLADVVLAPYQRHVGMSGILLLAAAAGKPVLSSNYGLMGELVRRYHLGVAVDSTVPAELALGLRHCLTEPLETLGNLTLMKEFAEQNSVERYASTIFQNLYPSLNRAKPNTNMS